MPKPELNGLGATFAECEFRHSEAYSRLLEVLGYNDEFNNVIEIPAIRERIDYLNTVLANAKSTNHKRVRFFIVIILYFNRKRFAIQSVCHDFIFYKIQRIHEKCIEHHRLDFCR